MSKQMEWIVGDDTGVSSKTIWSVMMGAKNSEYTDIPHDPSDFGRCYRLLELVPMWKGRLQEVADKYPKWQPMVDVWDELSDLYEQELSNNKDCAPKLYQRMKVIADECKIADGWIQISKGMWVKS